MRSARSGLAFVASMPRSCSMSLALARLPRSIHAQRGFAGTRLVSVACKDAPAMTGAMTPTELASSQDKEKKATSAETVKPAETIAERDARLMAAFKEKLGGDATAQFEEGQATEMKRSVRKNMFRYI